MNRTLISITSLGFAVLFAAACSDSGDTDGNGGSGNNTSGTGGKAGSGVGGSSGSTAATGGTGAATGGTAGAAPTTGGTGGVVGSGGTAGAVSTGGAGGTGTGGSAGLGTGGTDSTTGGAPTTGGAAGTGGSDVAGTAGMAGSGGGGVEPDPVLPALVTSANNAFWKTDGTLTESTANATVTVNDTESQTWEGFGGSFNELGWSFLTTAALQAEALKLLFNSAEGAAFAWGRIPMGSSDYGMNRYTLDDTGTDVVPNSGESNRPAADTSMAMFSLARDGEKLIPYIKAAQGVRPTLKFWASPWTPPVWMKTGFKANSGADANQNATKPSYFDGGNMKSDAATLTAYALYYTKFVEGYAAQGIDIDVVSPQNEPGYDQNYPSCLWDGATYTNFIKTYLGPAMAALNVKVMLGSMSNAGDGGRNDLDIASTVLADATAKSFLSVAGAQWGVLARVTDNGATFGGLPIWATEHKCGNYPWNPSGYPAYNSSQAPNDMAYGVESWGYIRDAINKGKVTAYNAWNMVLDKSGLGIDTTRDWKQNALLVVDGGMVKPTPAYYVFRHMSQYAKVGAKVVGTSSTDAVAFKNPDGSIVVTVYNSGAANPNYVVALGGKKYQFAMPAAGWATVKYTPE